MPIYVMEGSSGIASRIYKLFRWFEGCVYMIQYPEKDP